MKKPQYVRKEIYTVDQLLSKVELHHTKKDIAYFDGDPIKLGSDRYKIFKLKGTTCVTCKIVGTFFAKEKFKKSSIIDTWHMNLYAIDDKGNEVLMTKDHIQAKFNGGKNSLDNYQPMCTLCNEEKGHKE